MIAPKIEATALSEIISGADSLTSSLCSTIFIFSVTLALFLSGSFDSSS
jgi:hypothetical protein